MLPICSKPHGKLLCISKGTYTYFNLETTYHHLFSPRISQHHPFWNPAVHFHPHFLAPSVMVIAARWMFHELKSCLVSANPFQMVSHGSWDKEANSQHHLLACTTQIFLDPAVSPALTMEEPPWTCNSLPPTLVLPSHCSPSGMFFSPSLFTCWALLKLQVFNWNVAF